MKLHILYACQESRKRQSRVKQFWVKQFCFTLHVFHGLKRAPENLKI